MIIEEFIKALNVADFKKLVGTENFSDFLIYMNDIDDKNQDRLVLRILFQEEQPDGVPLPYYLWISYPISEENGFIEIYLPDTNMVSSLLDIPEELRGYQFYSVPRLMGRKGEG